MHLFIDLCMLRRREAAAREEAGPLHGPACHLAGAPSYLYTVHYTMIYIIIIIIIIVIIIIIIIYVYIYIYIYWTTT